MSLGSVLERLEINPPSRVQGRLLQITDTVILNRQWILQSKSQNGCQLSQLSSEEVTRRNLRLCLFSVDKDLHW